MPKVRIELAERDAPAATITVPVWFVAAVSETLPPFGGKKLCEHVDLETLRTLASDPATRGVILDIEDHEDGGRLTVSIVGD